MKNYKFVNLVYNRLIVRFYDIMNTKIKAKTGTKSKYKSKSGSKSKFNSKSKSKPQAKLKKRTYKGKKYKNDILKLTSGVFNSLIDVCLFVFFLNLNGLAMSRGKVNILQAIDSAVSLTKITNANSLKRVIYRAKHKSWIKKKEDYLKITQKGMDRLRRIMPEYEEKRPWDGIIYLITYDIPEERRKSRDWLRDYIERLGCAMMQRSVWLTPYNPKKLIAEFVKDNRIAGLVLVSELKEGSYIGGKPIDEALEKIYRLDDIYVEYMNFLREVEKGEIKGPELIMRYFAVLKKDPQLPFELLPAGWPCKEANEYYEKELKKMRKKGGDFS